MVVNEQIKYIKNIMEQNSLTSLEEIAQHLKELLKTETKQDICKKANIDKSALWRLEHGENINLSNYLKIKNAYPFAFKAKTLPGISQVPLLGQVCPDGRVRVLNASQANKIVVPTNLVSTWSPVFGYLNEGGTAFNECVYLFSTKYILSTQLNFRAVGIVIIVFIDGRNPFMGRLRDTGSGYELFHVITKEILQTFEYDAPVNWARFVGQVPLSLMEYTEVMPEVHEVTEDTDRVHFLKKDIDIKYGLKKENYKTDNETHGANKKK